MFGFKRKKPDARASVVYASPPSAVSGPLPLGTSPSFAPTPLYEKFASGKTSSPYSSSPSLPLKSNSQSNLHTVSNNTRAINYASASTTTPQESPQQRRNDQTPPSSFRDQGPSKEKRRMSIDSITSVTSDLPSAFATGTKQRRGSVHFQDPEKPLPPPKPESPARNATPPGRNKAAQMASPAMNGSPSQHRISLAPSKDMSDRGIFNTPPRSEYPTPAQFTQPTIRRAQALPDQIALPARPISVLPTPSGMMSPPSPMTPKKSRTSKYGPPENDSPSSSMRMVTRDALPMHANPTQYVAQSMQQQSPQRRRDSSLEYRHDSTFRSPSMAPGPLHSVHEGGSMSPPGLDRHDQGPVPPRIPTNQNPQPNPYPYTIPPNNIPSSQFSGARVSGHTRVWHEQTPQQHVIPPHLSPSPQPQPSYYSSEVSRALSGMGQNPSGSRLSKVSQRRLPSPPTSVRENPHQPDMSQKSHSRAPSVSSPISPLPPSRHQPSTNESDAHLRNNRGQQQVQPQRDINGTVSTNASNSPSKSSMSHDGSGFGFRDATNGHDSATSISSMESGNKMTAMMQTNNSPEGTYRPEQSESQQIVAAVKGATGQQSPVKVSYSPMPARTRGSLLVDKRGRLIPRTMSPVPPKVESPPPEPEEEEHVDETIYPLEQHLSSFPLFMGLLPYLDFMDFLALSSLNQNLRKLFDAEDDFREEILEKYLGSIGYWRWDRILTLASDAGARSTEVLEPLELNLKDMYSYMRAINLPAHRYADYAEEILANRSLEGVNGSSQVKLLAKASRAYTRVILRLRAQADAEAMLLASMTPEQVALLSPAPMKRGSVAPSSYAPVRERDNQSMRGLSRPPSRAGSVASSIDPYTGPMSAASQNFPGSHLRPKFRSPLYRPRHAPLLRVFVLSPEGAWMSDATILECEKELKRSCSGAKGRLSKNLLKVGDIIWNCAVTDEANLGRSIWDGNYLIDLDYTYSKMGGIPKYLHSLSFPPSYFHKVLRAGSGNDADPIVQINLQPFGDQIAANLQLLQERVAMETPQGNRHTVLRWTHRSKFRLPLAYRTANTLAIPIPNTELFIDAAWAGTVVVETEGTNEGLAELQARCGAAFPQLRGKRNTSLGGDNSRVFRIMRERSRPGEIWIRLVREKDRVL